MYRGTGPVAASRIPRNVPSCASWVTKDLGLDKGFHVYGFEWTPTQYRFFIDGKLTWKTGPVSQRPQYLILSCEVQDNGWAGKTPTGGYGARQTAEPAWWSISSGFMSPWPPNREKTNDQPGPPHRV